MDRQQLDDYTVEGVDRMLFGLLGSNEQVGRWWKSPNKAFEMKTPIEVWMEDQNGPQRVYQYVGNFCFGR